MQQAKGYQFSFSHLAQNWVNMLAGQYNGPGKEAVAWNQARTSDMVFTQPVVHEFDRLLVPTLLFIGGKDRTTPGANRTFAELAKTLGDYPSRGREAAKRIPQ